MDFKARYDGIHNSGFSKLQSGDFKPWTGLPENDRKNPVVAARVKVVGEAAIMLAKIEEIADANQVKVSLANRDFPLHLTLKLAKVNMPEGATDCSSIAAFLIGQSFTFSHLAVTPNMIMGSEEGPARVAGIRELLDAAFREQNLPPEPLDIFHATVARMMDYHSVGGLQSYATALIKLREELAIKPVSVIVDSIYWGTVEDLLEEQTKAST